MKDYITIIGGGLAGCEAAYQIAKRGIKVKLYEMKPIKYSPAHSNKDLAEIVCSNSFKSNLLTNACGLLKEELRRLDSLLINIADKTSVPAGQALAVDRAEFSKKVTEKIQQNELIEIINKEVVDIKNIIKDGIVIIATGPLTSDDLSVQIQKITGQDKLYFYDAAAPIVTKNSIDFNIAFYGDRYSQEKQKEETIEQWKERLNKDKTEQSYINLPMSKEEYEEFYNDLINAEVVNLHEFEKREIFEGCMPIEVMAKRGIDTLRYGPLKPVGFDDPRTAKRPYAQAKQEISEQIDYNGYENSQIQILAALTRLRQICCHPSLFIEDYKEESSKLEQCIEIIQEATTSGHKILLFSGYTSMFDIIEKKLKKLGIKYYKLTGSTKVEDRIKLVEDFNKNPEIQLFLISLKAGGTGLNLTGADMVIHYDPWWNISTENQATDRAYRIGQKNNVQVYKLITKNSIEEKIYELQNKKSMLIDNVLSTKTSFINKLSKEDIMSLFE